MFGSQSMERVKTTRRKIGRHEGIALHFDVLTPVGTTLISQAALIASILLPVVLCNGDGLRSREFVGDVF